MDKPQVSIPPAANVLGTIGTVVGVFRIYHTWRIKSTEGLPGSMLILWSICGVPFGVYAIVQNFNFALKFQPQAFAALTLISWGQTLYYHNKWRVWTATLATIALASSFAIMEVILILTLQGPYDRGVEWPMMLMAISATVIQIAGLIPPYFELAKRNGRVIGIDFWFLLIDYAGAFFSLMAVIAQQWFDALGASLYIACMVLETGIFASQAIWLWRVRHIRREAKAKGQTYDEYIKENPGKRLRSESAETVVGDEEACCNQRGVTESRMHSVSGETVTGDEAGDGVEKETFKQKGKDASEKGSSEETPMGDTHTTETHTNKPTNDTTTNSSQKQATSPDDTPSPS